MGNDKKWVVIKDRPMRDDWRETFDKPTLDIYKAIEDGHSTLVEIMHEINLKQGNSIKDEEYIGQPKVNYHLKLLMDQGFIGMRDSCDSKE